ncbi:interferon-induced protein 44-like [Alosa pseudoharengus]|uniref:interferon-induced protein 44-like n=1 Tax=Alosa pseudoharengus TaxID=34774 RepID=UPI003F8C7E9E
MGTTPSAPKLQDQCVKRGQSILFSWKANTGVYAEWMKDGNTLVNGGRISIYQSKDYMDFTLTISDAKNEDEGRYTLVLWNRKGRVSGSATVKVLEYDVDWRTVDWRGNASIKKVLRELRPSNPNVNHLRFLLHGPVGAGKSSVINSINCVFQGCINVNAPVAAASGTSYTKVFKTHAIKDKDGKALPFVFNDIMGLEDNKTAGVSTADVISALRGHIKDGYTFNPVSQLSENDKYYNSSPNLNDKIHCLVSVIPADKIPLLDDTSGVIVKMKEVRELANDMGIPQVVFMTHVDKCCHLVMEDLKHIYSSKKIKQAMQHCSNKLGVPMNCIFPVKNYNEENRVDEKINCLILDGLNQIVNFANYYVGSI